MSDLRRVLCVLSSIQLLGDLLYQISGVSGKMSTETAGDDDNFGTEHSQQVGPLPLSVGGGDVTTSCI